MNLSGENEAIQLLTLAAVFCAVALAPCMAGKRRRVYLRTGWKKNGNDSFIYFRFALPFS